MMITEDNPDAYEIKAIKDFESKKKKENIGLDNLEILDLFAKILK